MFILYAVQVGLVLGLLLGGRPAGLATLQFRFGWVMVAGLLVQVVLFAPAVSDVVGELGPPIYILSTAVVIVSVLLANAYVCPFGV